MYGLVEASLVLGWLGHYVLLVIVRTTLLLSEDNSYLYVYLHFL
jgi:hypothetical protein